MVIIDEKCFRHPPPAYDSHPPPPFNAQQRRANAKLAALPPHILLQIVYSLFPQITTEESPEIHRKILYWMSIRLRLVNRSFYIACMHILRSTYLPAYDSLIRPPYSSDPFPLSLPAQPPPSSSPSSTNAPLRTIQRETQILDLFIATKVREDVWLDDSELHLEREESFKDLFDLMQPRSRLEDLVRKYGEREGVVVGIGAIAGASGSSAARTSSRGVGGKAGPSLSSPPSSSSSSALKPKKILPLAFALLSIQFSSRKVGLQLVSQGRKRTIVEVPRTKETRLESTAKQLVAGLRGWLAS